MVKVYCLHYLLCFHYCFVYLSWSPLWCSFILFLSLISLNFIFFHTICLVVLVFLLLFSALFFYFHFSLYFMSWGWSVWSFVSGAAAAEVVVVSWSLVCIFVSGLLSQTSFSHISINSSSILTVSMATESPWKDLSISTSHASKQSVLAEILGRSTGNHHSTVY